MSNTADDLEPPKPKTKRRSIYEIFQEECRIKPKVDEDYTKKYLLELETQKAVKSELIKSYEELQNQQLVIEADFSKLNGKQKKFLKKKPNYNNYLDSVEDLWGNVQDKSKLLFDSARSKIQGKFRTLDTLQDKIVYKP